MDIKSFTIDNGLREEVQLYIHEYLKKKIIERAFAGIDVKDIAEARKVIDEAFNQMVLEYVRIFDLPEVNENE